MHKYLSLLGWVVLVTACHNTQSADENASLAPAVAVPATMNYTIINVFPHDTSSYTEGLEWHNNALYESSGDPDSNGKTKLVNTDLANGKTLKEVRLSKEYFGEGITIFKNKIYQLTWKNGECYVYDLATFKKIKVFTYSGEGWGMTHDDKYLIMDDGSNNLYYRDPETFQIVKSVGVYDNYGPLAHINELEYVDGYLYANVWLTNDIVKIDPKTGNVVAKADLTGLIDKYAPGAISEEDQVSNAVLNGIAYDSTGKRFFITGKLWPKLFEVSFH